MNLLGLDGKRCLVVGGGAGIGRSTSLLLAASGARVVVVDRDLAAAEAVVAEVDAGGHSARALAADVTVREEAERLVTEAHHWLGGLDCVANIVGVAAWADVMSADDELWDAQFAVNLRQHLHVARPAARYMIDEGVAGSFAFVTSVSGIYGAPGHAAYGAAKAGLSSLTRSLAVEWGGYGIRVNAVAPDFIAAPRIIAAHAAAGFDDMGVVARDEGVPLGRWGSPEEIAGPLVFLLSELSSYMSGQEVVVDGGTIVSFSHRSSLLPFRTHTPSPTA